MRTLLHVLITALALTVCNALIWQKNAVVTGGTTMLLRLAPRDPRSLMQGDYMALNYEVTGKLRALETARRGAVVMHLDERQVATFIRMHGSEPLAPGEVLLQFRRNTTNIRLGAESFFFQEGTAAVYEPAKYGELRVATDGASVLVGLRDEQLTPLGAQR